jgi:phosphate-selective porin
MKLNKLIRITALSAALVGSVSYATSNDALLDLLVKKGVLTDSEATAVAAELKEENEGITFSAKGKETVKLRFNGRMHFQYDSLDADADGTDLDSTNHFYFRRLRLGVKATHENGLFAETALDFSGDEESELGVDKAVAGYEFSDAFTGMVGYQKVPFGFQETTSSSKIKTIERSAANRFFADDIDFAGRHTGLHAKGNLGGGFSYAAAIVNGAQGEGSKLLGSAEASNDLAAFGRVQWSGNDLTLGVDVGNQSNNEVVGQDVTAFTAYANYKSEGFDILGEYFSADMDDQEDAEGYSLRVAYKFDKFEPVFRYSHLKNDTFVIDADELIRRAPEGDRPDPLDNLSNATGGDNEIDSYYFGFNYYYNKAVSLMVGYEIAETDSDTGDEVEIDGLRARLQILW